jgi:2-keto-4-pentenoate hydratase/2-oxohepta-3-ene-1,7-dioic acid hydratase in catechol pathway
MRRTHAVTVDSPGDEAGRTVQLTYERLLNAGYTGRDEAAVRAHVEELEEEGVPAPETVPALYPKPGHLLTSDDAIEVLSAETSGEAEFALFVGEDATYVGVGSDHTDRELERDSVPLSKAVCPNVVSDRVWRLDDCRDHWDEIELRSWTSVDGERRRYQEDTLASIKPPEALVAEADERMTVPVSGTVLFSGSVATLEGILHGDRFEAELHDPVLERTLRCAYDVSVVDWLA